jgi:hypothetical protein
MSILFEQLDNPATRPIKNNFDRGFLIILFIKRGWEIKSGNCQTKITAGIGMKTNKQSMERSLASHHFIHAIGFIV